MKALRVMNSSGDTVAEFDEQEAQSKEIQEAKDLFEPLVGEGVAVFAVNRGFGVKDKRVRDFTELESNNLAVPRIVGG